MHVLSDLRSGFVEAEHCRLGSEADLVFKEVFKLVESNTLVCRGVNPPDDSELLSLCQEQRIPLKESIQVYFVNFALILSIYRSVHG